MNASDEAAYRRAPLKPTTVTVGTGSTSAITLSTIDGWYDFQADGGKIYYRFGSTTGMSAATTNDWHIPDGDKEPYIITADRRYVRFIAESSGIKLRYGESG